MKKLFFVSTVLLMTTGAIASACSQDNTGIEDSAVTSDVATISSTTKHDTVTIAMTGDIMLGTTFPKPKLPPNDGREIFVDCADILQSADVACGNLEGVIADEGKPRKNVNSPRAFMFLMPTKNAPRLSEAGYDFVGLANNHIFDFFEEPVKETEKTLDDIGVGYAGRKECESTVKEINGRKFGFCAFGHEVYSLRTQDTATVRRVITELRPKCDYLIVCFHGGAEGAACRHTPVGAEYFYGDNRGDVRQFAHLAIDCGADIVYGHGPHVVRAMELYKDHLIAYSLGNFATPLGMGVVGLTGYAPLLTARLDEHGRLIDGQIHSFIQYPGKGPRTDSGCHAAKEIRTLSLEDFPDSKLVISENGALTVKK